MDAADTVRAYYGALERGEPLAPFFAARDDVVKVGISERLSGYDSVAAGLREQTRTTTGWTVESHRLQAIERGSAAWFSDVVTLAWTERDTGTEHAFETRWSGILERVDEGRGREDGDDGWRFVGMHVSAPHDLSGPTD